MLLEFVERLLLILARFNALSKLRLVVGSSLSVYFLLNFLGNRVHHLHFPTFDDQLVEELLSMTPDLPAGPGVDHPSNLGPLFAVDLEA